MRMTDLRPGWDVLGNDGRRVGTIRDVRQHYIVTSRPGFAPDLFVPVSWIAMVQNETVHLSLPQRDVGQMGWEQEPRDDEELETGPESDLHRHI
jgi:hypothetical protein